MTIIAAVVAAVAVVVGVEVALLMTTEATTHAWPGGFTVFGVLGAVILVRVAKAVGAIGVQEPAREPDDDD
jgi:hypothetical protein